MNGKANTEKLLERELVFAGRLLVLQKDKVKLAGGHVTHREVVRHPGAVAIAPVDAAGNLVLVRQYRYPVDEELLEVPAGKLEKGEEPLATAHRELAEETGLVALYMQPVAVFFTTPGFCDERMHLFLATGLRQAPEADIHPDADEAIKVERIPLGEAVEMCADGRIRDAKTMAAVFLVRGALGDAPAMGTGE